jgi:hypothetical protein
LFCVKVLSAYFLGLGVIGVALMIPFPNKEVKASRISRAGSTVRVDVLDESGEIRKTIEQEQAEETFDEKSRGINSQKSGLEDLLVFEEKFVVLDNKEEKVEQEYMYDDFHENVGLLDAMKTKHIYLISSMIFLSNGRNIRSYKYISTFLRNNS